MVGGTYPNDLDARPVMRIVDELPLRVEMAYRAVVSRGVLAIAMAGARFVLEAELRRGMVQAGQGVQSRAAQGRHPVEAEQSGQQ
jgi:hypothetical protein